MGIVRENRQPGVTTRHHRISAFGWLLLDDLDTRECVTCGKRAQLSRVLVAHDPDAVEADLEAAHRQEVQRLEDDEAATLHGDAAEITDAELGRPRHPESKEALEPRQVEHCHPAPDPPLIAPV